MLQGITYGTYIVFGVLTFLGAAFIWFFVPETKRLTLEEMVRLWMDKILSHIKSACLFLNKTRSR